MQQDNQLMTEIEQPEEFKEISHNRQENQQDRVCSYENLAQVLQNLSIGTNPNVARLTYMNKFSQEIIDHLTKFLSLNQDGNLNDLNGPFWQNLYLKLKQYHKYVMYQLFCFAAFLLVTSYYSFQQFDMQLLGAKLIIMYVMKNIIELYLTNQQLNIISKKIEDYEQLKEKLTEQQKQFQIHIDNIKTNQLLLQQQIQIQNELNQQQYIQQQQLNQDNEPRQMVQQLLQMFGVQHLQVDNNAQNHAADQVLTQTMNTLGQTQIFLQHLKDDDGFKRKQLHIALLKDSVIEFQKNFLPYDDFIQQTQKQSLTLIKQVIIRQSSSVLYLSYLMKMAIVALTLINSMILFTDASYQLTPNFKCILWMNLIQDHIQVFALAFFLVFLVGFFICFFIFTRAVILIKKIKHQRKLQQSLNSLKKSKYIKSDNPNATKECSICLNDYDEEEIIVTLNCDPKHVFHQNCIETWVKQKDECPLCRAQIFV